MKLSRLLADLDVIAQGRGPGSKAEDPVIEGIYCRAQQVKAGGLFVAVKGFAADGHDYIDQAVSNGAVAVVCEKPVTADVAVIQVNNSRKALAEIAATFYGRPSQAMTVIGLTGTNGKTTTSYLIESILKAAGCSVGVIGTINYRYAGNIFDNPVTTPESLDLQRIMAEMREAGVTHLVMEVSSHALDLYRVHGCKFDIAVFTNFTQDHLDYHKQMAAYWGCKRRLFTEVLPALPSAVHHRAVINTADPRGGELARVIGLPHLTSGSTPGSDLSAISSRFDLRGTHARITSPPGKLDIESPLVGRHNLENILNAVGVGVALGIAPRTIAAGIKALENVPGRLERVDNPHQRFVYVDYAHTPDALENALLALRALTADRMICIFGCGGDRDRSKRPQMGAIAARFSDLVVVTSDNPRTEKPEVIIAEIVAGVRQVCAVNYAPEDLKKGFKVNGYTVIPDRRTAIRGAIAASRAGDTLLIAGKGHEPYQVVGREKLPFDDRQEARNALAELL